MQSSNLSYVIHSAQSDNPAEIAVCADPMRVRTRIFRKIQSVSTLSTKQCRTKFSLALIFRRPLFRSEE